MTRKPRSRIAGAVHEMMGDLHHAGVLADETMRRFDAQCLAAPGEPAAAARGLTFDVYKDVRGEWRWRLVLGTGQAIASSAASHNRKRDCLAAIEIVRTAATAEVAVG